MKLYFFDGVNSMTNEQHRTNQNKSVSRLLQTDFLPEFTDEKRDPSPFVNEFGVIIGDGKYNSPQSPLNQWSKDTDPAIMAGDQWVHPYNDIGFNTKENRDYFEKGIVPKGSPFMHPTIDVSYDRD
jgi:hypothetical protein